MLHALAHLGLQPVHSPLHRGQGRVALRELPELFVLGISVTGHGGSLLLHALRDAGSVTTSDLISVALSLVEELYDLGIDGIRMSDWRHVAKTCKLYDSGTGKNWKKRSCHRVR